MTKPPSKMTTIFLILTALGIWVFNLKKLLPVPEAETLTQAKATHAPTEFTIDDKIRMLREMGPAQPIKLNWDPFLVKPIGLTIKKQATTTPQPPKETPAPPPPFPFTFAGYLQGDQNGVQILKHGGGLLFLQKGDWAGDWQLMEITPTHLIFKDEKDHTRTLEVEQPSPQ